VHPIIYRGAAGTGTEWIGFALNEDLSFGDVSMTVETTYPHIEKIEGSPVRLQRMPRIRVAQVVMDYLYQVRTQRLRPSVES
jgi:hypothetical protein